ncbi:MAG: response regulator transcription factor [Pseudomonadota bacterium]|nr:response regulator transcription factor [Pseudomonadota bacterium]
MSAPTIVIAEDHPMFREALALTLNRILPGAVLLEVASHQELVDALLSQRNVQLVLLDLRMPGTHGLSSLVFLRGEYPALRVAIISGGAYAETIDRVRKLGASAFIPKSAPIETISRALACVIRGEEWYQETDGSTAERNAQLRGQLNTLTAQQYRVLKYLVDGMLNKQIADILNVSEGTVRTHVTAILQKLGVSTRTQAVIFVTELDQDREGADAL